MYSAEPSAADDLAPKTWLSGARWMDGTLFPLNPEICGIGKLYKSRLAHSESRDGLSGGETGFQRAILRSEKLTR